MDLNKLTNPKSQNILVEETTEEKPKKELLTASIVVKCRPSEKRILEDLGEKQGLKLSPLIRSLLKKHGYI